MNEAAYLSTVLICVVFSWQNSNNSKFLCTFRPNFRNGKKIKQKTKTATFIYPMLKVHAKLSGPHATENRIEDQNYYVSVNAFTQVGNDTCVNC